MLRKPVHKIENKIECVYGQKCKDYMTKKCNHCDRNENKNKLESYYNEDLDYFCKKLTIGFLIFGMIVIGFVLLIAL